MIVIVGPFRSHKEWNVSAAQFCCDARQQSFQSCSLCTTGFNKLVKLAKYPVFVPTM